MQAPTAQCYAWWRGLTDLPQVAQWKVHAPLGTNAGALRFDDHGGSTGAAFTTTIERAAPATGPTVEQT